MKEAVCGVLRGVIAQGALGGVKYLHIMEFVVSDTDVSQDFILEVLGLNSSGGVGQFGDVFF